MASSVSVLVIDCTRTGAFPPTVMRALSQTTSDWREARFGDGPRGNGGRQFDMVLVGAVIGKGNING
jgi:hypothetical protein